MRFFLESLTWRAMVAVGRGVGPGRRSAITSGANVGLFKSNHEFKINKVFKVFGARAQGARRFGLSIIRVDVRMHCMRRYLGVSRASG